LIRVKAPGHPKFFNFASYTFAMKSLFSFLAFSLFISSGVYSQSSVLLNADDFDKGIQQAKVQVLDVRTAAEYQTGHISHAFQADWNLPDQFRDRVSHLDKSLPIYVYCLSGGRSGKAAEWMASQGFKSVFALKGGINAWKQAGKPLENPVAVPQIKLEELMQQIGSSGSTLVDFGAEWCPPCKEMEPILEQLKKEKGNKFHLLKVDGGSQTGLMADLKVEALPTFIVFTNGKETWRKQGVCSLQEINSHLP
jgi:rhodanese-related sulfurtransferase